MDKCINYGFDIRCASDILLEEGACDALCKDRHLLESTIARVERYLSAPRLGDRCFYLRARSADRSGP